LNTTSWHEALQSVLLGNSLETWLYAILTALLTLSVLPLAKRAAVRRVGSGATAGRRWELLAALIHRTTALFFVALAIYLASQSLTFPPRAARVLEIAVLIAVWFQLGLWVSEVVVHVLRNQLLRRGAHHLALASGFTVVSFIAQALVWLVAIALALANAGVNIIALLTGLGTGGAAIALALRSWLSNLFANASISLDNVFAVGDSLVSGEFQGKVEQIGSRSTLIRSVNGELILIPNQDLLKSRLRNFGRIEERREVLTIRLARDTPAVKVREAVELITQIIRTQPLARFDRCHFAQLNLEALLVEAVYHVRNGAVSVLADVRDTIDAQVHAAFADAQIDVEYPLQRFDRATG
jgi:small-conductance mechanosensitive channel